MKKSKFMRVAAILMAAVLLTTCAISGTFAKYVTTASATDNARVAKWGFGTTSMSITGLFANTYLGTGDQAAANTVVGQESADVIAPGTSGQATFTFAPPATAPEVAYTFTVNATGSVSDDIVNNTNIKWGLDSVGTEALTFAELLAAINALDGESDEATNGAKVYMPGQTPTAFAAAGTGAHIISWTWAFSANDKDGLDTTMGNKTTLDTASITIAITATQID